MLIESSLIEQLSSVSNIFVSNSIKVFAKELGAFFWFVVVQRK